MKIICISDTHGQHRKLNLPKGDILIHAGDFCHYGSHDGMYDFLEWFKRLNYKYKLLIGGNHDFFAYEYPKKFKELLPKDIIYLNDSGTKINGFNIWGSPVQPDLPGWAFSKKRGKEMEDHWKMIPEDTDILITHTPPFRILDKTTSGKSIGCEELRIRLELIKPKVHIFGHVHASYGETRIKNTKFINAASMHSFKGLANSPIVFSINKN